MTFAVGSAVVGGFGVYDFTLNARLCIAYMYVITYATTGLEDHTRSRISRAARGSDTHDAPPLNIP